MIAAHQIVYVLMAHYISCFLFQTDIMASQKANHNSWMILHSGIYVCSLFFLMLLGMVVFQSWTWTVVWKFTLINMATYFIIDSVMSRVNFENKELKQHYLLNIGMGFEQLMHAAILIYSLSYLLQ